MNLAIHGRPAKATVSAYIVRLPVLRIAVFILLFSQSALGISPAWYYGADQHFQYGWIYSKGLWLENREGAGSAMCDDIYDLNYPEGVRIISSTYRYDGGSKCRIVADDSGRVNEYDYTIVVRRIQCRIGKEAYYDQNGFVKCRKAEPRPIRENPLCPSTGNPINLLTGNKHQIEVDIAEDLFGGYSFSRKYNSSDAYSGGTFGAHWRHAFESRLTRIEEPAASVMIVRRANGQEMLFMWSESLTEWLPRYGARGQLKSVTDATGVFLEYRYYPPDGATEAYDVDGRLSRVDTAHGEQVTLEYDDAGRLAFARAKKGGELSFTYQDHPASTEPLVASVALGSFDIRYEYDEMGRLTAASYPGASTESVRPRRTYRYEDPRHPHALTGILDERGILISSWAYDDAGRAVESRASGGVDVVTVQPSTTTDQVVVTRSNGHLERYVFIVIEGRRRLLEKYQTVGGTERLVERNSYSNAGQLVSREDAKGAVTTYEYDAHGREIRRVEAAGLPEAKVIETQWHPTISQPTSIRADGKLVQWTYDDQGQVTEVQTTAEDTP